MLRADNYISLLSEIPLRQPADSFGMTIYLFSWGEEVAIRLMRIATSSPVMPQSNMSFRSAGWRRNEESNMIKFFFE
jgi:hypothetical protein